MSAHQSLTVILPLVDALACRAELERQRAALEAGWAEIPGLVSACLVLLPADPELERAPPALLVECSFETELGALLNAWFGALGGPLSAVLRHCVGYPESANARDFAEYLGVRARRSAAFADAGAPRREIEIGRGVLRAIDALRALGRVARDAPANPQILEDEARCSALGMQEPLCGVPLVHAAWLVPGSRARVQRALRDLECTPAPLQHDLRFLLDGARLVFLAYPSESAARWSERLSQLALVVCARIWRNCRGFPSLFLTRRRRRPRRLQQFVLEARIPVAAWFNARARPASASARRES